MNVHLDVYIPEYPRICYAEMPAFEKDISQVYLYSESTDLGVIVPLFFNSTTRKYQQGYELLPTHGFMKRSIYLIWELLNYTDARDLGVPIYLTMTRRIREMIGPYLEACRFPESKVIIVELSDDEYIGHLPKFPLMREAVEKCQLDKVISFDSSIYFVGTQDNDIFARIRKDWSTQPILNLVRAFGDVGYYDTTYDQAVGHHRVQLSEEAYYRRVSEITGMSVEEFKFFWKNLSPRLKIQGRSQGYSRDVILSHEFWDFLNTVKSLTGNDQTVTSLYWQKYLGKQEDIVTPEGIDWYPVHPKPITHGNIGFLDSSKSLGAEARTEWIRKTTDIGSRPILQQTEGNWEHEGYTIKRGLIPRSSCQKAVDFLFRGDSERIYGQPDTYTPFTGDSVVMEKIDYGTATEVNVWKNGYRWRDRRIREETWVWREIVNHPAIRETVEFLIGDVYEPNNPYTFGKIQGADLRGIYGVLPNSEGDRIHIDGHPFDCGVVVLLDDVAPNGGCFSIYPGSHRLGFPEKTRDLDETQRHSLPEPLLFSGGAGDVIFWHPKLAHQEQPNTTEDIRIILFHDWVKRSSQ